MKYYGNWELSGKELPEQFFIFSEAYFDSAERLCKLLKRSTRKASYTRGCVVLYLAFHAAELFLKGSILEKNPEEKLTHNLEGYFNRYTKLYPSKKFRFELPFLTEYAGLEPNEIALGTWKILIPFIMFSYRKEGGIAYEDIDFGSKWCFARIG